jgi:hypothetical protein
MCVCVHVHLGVDMGMRICVALSTVEHFVRFKYTEHKAIFEM